MGADFDGQSLLLVMVGALFTTSLAEFLSWVLVYRHESYRDLKGSSYSTQERSKDSTRRCRRKKAIT